MTGQQPSRTRRPPPPLRRCAVVDVTPRSPRMIRVALAGEELVGLAVDEPASSVRLLVAGPGEAELVLPEWNGNEFLDGDGNRPLLRTFTPLRADPVHGRLELDIVRHRDGAISEWAEAATPGTPAAISGPGRGYTVDADAAAFFLLGDETAIPAIGQLLAEIPSVTPVEVHVEIAEPGAELALPDHPSAAVRWHVNVDDDPGATLVTALREAELPDGVRVWAAGEAASMQTIRRHLFDERNLPRAAATIRGYWKRR